jgi:hypothetical protein
VSRPNTSTTPLEDPLRVAEDAPVLDALSGYLPGPVSDPGDHVHASAQRSDVGTDDIDAGDLAMLDLGDAAAADQS